MKVNIIGSWFLYPLYAVVVLQGVDFVFVR